MSVEVTKPLLQQVNTEFNLQITYAHDSAFYSTPEFWEIATTYGDCEDYALAKRKKLLDLGVPATQLLIATCWTETNEYHAVLTVEFDDYVGPNSLVLDNRYTNIAVASALPYTWHLRQCPGEAKWEVINAWNT